MKEEPKAYYFKNDSEWREWLHENHASSAGIYLIFYTVAHEMESMRWEEAVQVAICYGWIDSTVKSLGDGMVLLSWDALLWMSYSVDSFESEGKSSLCLSYLS